MSLRIIGAREDCVRFRMDYVNLIPGYNFPPYEVVLNHSSTQQYCLATGTSIVEWEGISIIPPTAIAALALKGVLEHLQFAPGAIHTNQELTFLEIVPEEETVTATATVVRNNIRRGWHWLTIQLSVTDSKDRIVMTGKSTVLLPAKD